MYAVNIYRDFVYGDFKLLETKYVYAKDRNEAKEIVLKYAIDKYGENVSVMNVN